MNLFHRLPLVLAALWLVGCAGVPSRPAEEPPVKREAEKPKPTRELGSLWSPDSRWNEMYSTSHWRQIGDVMSVTITEAFKGRLLAMLPPENKPKESEPERKPADSTAKPEKKDEAATAANVPEHPLDTKSIELTIDEVLPRGVLHLVGTQMVQFGTRQATVNIDAKVREKEVSGDETVPGDALFAMTVEKSNTLLGGKSAIEEKNRTAQTKEEERP